ncbi:hypothetical protein ACH4OW_33940 [Streptomyces sp. NPDC017056]|uniref:hypothetical protein n=1 Tax=Streptomyces sp. NPDC017056 TaxID=3364973 RepID=UPI0037A7F300
MRRPGRREPGDPFPALTAPIAGDLPATGSTTQAVLAAGGIEGGTRGREDIVRERANDVTTEPKALRRLAGGCGHTSVEYTVA